MAGRTFCCWNQQFYFYYNTHTQSPVHSFDIFGLWSPYWFVLVALEKPVKVESDSLHQE